jgi:hypothetical protein
MVIPCVGGIFSLMVGLIGFGGVLLSRYGTQVYSPIPRATIYPPKSGTTTSEEPKPGIPPQEK